MEITGFILILIVGLQARSVIGGLSPGNGTDSPSDMANLEADQFLTSYGYYPSSAFLPTQVQNPSLREHSVNERTMALKLFQKLYDLPQSGKLNEETTTLMQSPRCGNPDNTSNVNAMVGVRRADIHLQKEGGVSQTSKGDEKQDRAKVEIKLDRGIRSVDTSRKKRVKRMKGSRTPGQLGRWRYKKMAWEITRPSKQTHLLPKRVQRSIMAEATSIWQRVVPFKFEENLHYLTADMQIMFHKFSRSSWNNKLHRDNAWRKDEENKIERPKHAPIRKGSHAHAMVPVSDGLFPHRDIHFDDEYDWSNHTELLSVLLHEIGHCLGLGHSSDTSAVMYPYNRGVTELSTSDTQGIKKLYDTGAQQKRHRPTPCDAIINKVDYVLKDPDIYHVNAWIQMYFVISGLVLHLISPLTKAFTTNKPIDELFVNAPSSYDVVFSDTTHNSVFFIDGNTLYQYKNYVEVTPKNISHGYFPETPMFAITIGSGKEENTSTLLFGAKYWWMFEFDGEDVVKPQYYPNPDNITKLLSEMKYAVQWIDGRMYAVKEKNRYVTLDVDNLKNFALASMRGKPDNDIRLPLKTKIGNPDWLETMLCPDHASAIRCSRPSLVLVIIFSLIKCY